jgi:hypothetical protein
MIGSGPTAAVLCHRHATSQDQRPALLHNGYSQPNPGGELDIIPDLDLLPLRDDRSAPSCLGLTTRT